MCGSTSLTISYSVSVYDREGECVARRTPHSITLRLISHSPTTRQKERTRMFLFHLRSQLPMRSIGSRFDKRRWEQFGSPNHPGPNRTSTIWRVHRRCGCRSSCHKDVGGEMMFFAGFAGCREGERIWAAKQYVMPVFESTRIHKN
jgi:hypothetical protein